MVRIINVCSGKGGVGKTTIVSNLGIALQKYYKKTVVIDFNFTTSHLSLFFGIQSHPITINHVLRNEASLEDAIYNHQSGLKIIPGSLKLKDIVDIDVDYLRKIIEKTFSNYDIVLIDSAPGLGREALIALKVSDEILYVANPSIPSLVDIAKYNELINNLENKPKPIGIVVNRVRNKGYEIKNDEIAQFTETPIIGVIPEDENILASFNRGLVTISKNRSPSKKEFFKIAAKIAGTEYKKLGLIEIIMKKIRGEKI